MIINTKKLKLLFEYMNHSGHPFIFLRGYQMLPESYSNDLDIFVSKDRLKEFFSLLRGSDLGVTVQVVGYRPGLIQTELFVGDEIHKLDVIYDFLFCGFPYMSEIDIKYNIINEKNFCVINEDQELRISFLKDALHNGRIRGDKVDRLLYLMSFGIFNEDHFFSNTDLDYIRSCITGRVYEIPGFRYKLIFKVISRSFGSRYFLEFIKFLRSKVLGWLPEW